MLLLCIGFGLVLLSGGWWLSAIGRQSRYRMEVVELDSNRGYGYVIKQGDRTVIFQPFVPALSNRKPFHSSEEAAKIGSLVLERLKSGQDFSVTKADLERLGVVK